MLDVALDASVEPREEDLDGVVLDPCFFEQRRERRARPLGVADRLFEPRLAQRAGREAGALNASGRYYLLVPNEVAARTVAATRD